MNADRSGDPNFPPGLRIQPSSSQRRPQVQSHCEAADQDQRHSALQDDQQAGNLTGRASWDQDTTEDIESFGIAGRIWEAAYLLARYLRPAIELPDELEFDPPCSLFEATSSQQKQPLTIVELGSGAGYGSLHLAHQLLQHARSTESSSPKTRLVLTDLENVVPLMQRNVALAGYQQATQHLEVSVRSLAWGNDAHATALISELCTAYSASGRNEARPNPLTHILCSDLVYFPELLPPLLRSIILLSEQALEADSSSGPELIISYKIRSLTKEQPFWSALDSWFDFRAVDCRPTSKPKGKNSATDDSESQWHRFGSEGEDYGASVASDQELFVFVGCRRKETVGCLAPDSDTDLMQGKRLRPRRGREGESILELEPSSGQGYFEWLLLANMAAGLG